MLSEHQITDLIIALAKARDRDVTYAFRMASGGGDTVARLDAGVGIPLRRAKTVRVALPAACPARDARS